MDLSRLEEYFQLKLQAEKQLVDVADSVMKRDSKLTLLDVRDREDFEKGHIPGAISMPLAEIDRRYREIPRDKEIVAYCYTQHCHLSTLAALKLVQHGIPAKEMNVGWKEWVNSNHPVHTPSPEDAGCAGQCRIPK